MLVSYLFALIFNPQATAFELPQDFIGTYELYSESPASLTESPINCQEGARLTIAQTDEDSNQVTVSGVTNKPMTFANVDEGIINLFDPVIGLVQRQSLASSKSNGMSLSTRTRNCGSLGTLLGLGAQSCETEKWQKDQWIYIVDRYQSNEIFVLVAKRPTPGAPMATCMFRKTSEPVLRQ